MELGNLMFGNSRGNYEIDREKYQDIFLEWLDAHGFDGYGLAADAQMAERFTSEGEDTRFENDVFVIRPYYWGEDARIAAKPNFVYKPDGLEICWYKYPMRDAYSNVPLDGVDLPAILEKCAESLV